MNLDNFPVSPSGRRLLGYVTKGWYDNSYVAKWLYEVMGQELDAAESHVKDTLDQLFPETATWGMRYHELKYGLDVREDLPIEDRRKIVLKKRDTKAPLTPFRQELIISSATGCKVEIADIMDGGNPIHPNVFDVRINVEGAEIGMKKLFDIVDSVKQSHTTYGLFAVICELLTEENYYFHSRIRTPFNWWSFRTLDGTYLLDGSTVMDVWYPDMFKIALRLSGTMPAEEFIISTVNSLEIHNAESYLSKLRQVLHFTWWNFESLDGSGKLDGEIVMDAWYPVSFEMSEKLQIGHKEDMKVYLYDQSLDKLLDGSCLLDGSVKMNSGREEL